MVIVGMVDAVGSAVGMATGGIIVGACVAEAPGIAGTGSAVVAAGGAAGIAGSCGAAGIGISAGGGGIAGGAGASTGTMVGVAIGVAIASAPGSASPQEKAAMPVALSASSRGVEQRVERFISGRLREMGWSGVSHRSKACRGFTCSVSSLRRGPPDNSAQARGRGGLNRRVREKITLSPCAPGRRRPKAILRRGATHFLNHSSAREIERRAKTSPRASDRA